MQRYQRLTRTGDFAAVRRARRSWADALLVLMVRPNELEYSRVGLSVGKRTGNAVVRNKTKRRLREAVRGIPAETGWDLVLVARKDAPSASFYELSRSVKQLFRRAGIVPRLPRDVVRPQKAGR